LRGATGSQIKEKSLTVRRGKRIRKSFVRERGGLVVRRRNRRIYFADWREDVRGSLDTSTATRFLSVEDFIRISRGMGRKKRKLHVPNPKEGHVEQEADGSWVRRCKQARA
jgi:hypothetical protein